MRRYPGSPFSNKMIRGIVSTLLLLLSLWIQAEEILQLHDQPVGATSSVTLLPENNEEEISILVGFQADAPNDIHLRRMKDAGFNAIIYPVFWNRYETDNGVFSSLYLAEIRGLLDYARQIDLQVVLKIQLHPQPDWLFRIYPDLAVEETANSELSSTQPVRASIHHAGLRKERNEFLMHLSREVRSHPALIALHVGIYPLPDFEIDSGIPAAEAFRKWNDKNARQAVMQRLGRMEGLADIFRFKAEIEKAAQGSSGKIPSLSEMETQREEWLNWMQFRRQAHLEYLSDYFSTLRSLFSQQSLVFTFENALITDCSNWKQAVFFDEVLPFTDIVGVYTPVRQDTSEGSLQIRNWHRNLTQKKPGWIFIQDEAIDDKDSDSTTGLSEIIHLAAERGMQGVFFQSLEKTFSGDAEAIENITLPVLHPEGEKSSQAQVALLLDWDTWIQMPDDPFSCSEMAALAALLIQEGIPVDFISSYRLLTEGLEGYKVLGVLGTVAVNDELLERINAFLDAGGAIIASDRFGEHDELLNSRKAPARNISGLYLDAALSGHEEQLREPIRDFVVRQGITPEDIH